MKKSIVSCLSLLVLGALSAPVFAGGITVAKSDKGALKLSSKIFVALTNKSEELNGDKTKDATGVYLDRAYFALKYKFDSVWSLGFTSDATLDTSLHSKQTRLYVKKAYFKGKFSHAAQLRMGVIGTPMIGYEDKLFKHRHVSKSYLDQQKFDSSADAGVALSGKLASKLISYDVAVVNGAGYSKISASQAMDLNARLGVYPVKGLTLDLNYRSGYMGKKTLGSTDVPKQTTVLALATYGSSAYRIGAEYVNHEKAESSAITDKGLILWGWTKMGQMGAFARFEQTDTNQAGNSVTEQESRYVVGADYNYSKHVRFSLALDHATIDQVGFVNGESKVKDRVGLYSVVKF